MESPAKNPFRTSISLNNGLLLSAVILANTTLGLSGCQSEQMVSGETTLAADGTRQSVEIEVKHGYSPNRIKAKPNLPIEILFKRNEDPSSCAKDLTFPQQNLTVNLPNHETYSVTIPAQPPGTTVPFKCTMDMMHGEILVGKEESKAS
jgi:plastocyanin domain-containing protein